MLTCKRLTGKRAFFALFSIVFLISCSTNQRQWVFDSNKASHNDFKSNRMLLSPENNFSGLEVEIIQTSQSRLVYLNSFGAEILPEGTTSEGYHFVNVTLTIDQQSNIYAAFLLNGGHRVLLPEDITLLIIDALHAHQTVEISIDQRSTVVIPDNFVNAYKKL